MRYRLTFALAVALLTVGALSGVTFATPQNGVTSSSIASGTFEELRLHVKTSDWMAQLWTKGLSTLQVVENRLAPGGAFGWHSHPGPSLIIVKEGAVTFYRGDDPSCSPDRREAGQTAFVDEGAIHNGRNEGTIEAVVVVVRMIPAGAGPRIDEVAQGNCSF